MDRQTIELEYDSEDSKEGDFKCPVCRETWFAWRDGGGVEHWTPCPHLRFICMSEDEVHCFNGMTPNHLNALLSPPLESAAAKKPGASEEPDPSDLCAHILSHRDDPEFWRKIGQDSVNALFEFMDCGSMLPDWGVLLFGAQLDPTDRESGKGAQPATDGAPA